MKIGDLIMFSLRPAHVLLGVVIDFDDVADGVLCFMFSRGKNLWFRKGQVKVVNASR